MEMIEQGIVVRAGIGDAHAMICAEGAGYAPDLVHDMMNRTSDLVENILVIAATTGYIELSSSESEEEEEEEVDGYADEWWIQ